MSTADEELTIAYNGEVYNFLELARRLGLSGLRSRTDTEVVLQAFRRLGVASLPLLNGMFAFAIFDKQQRKLWLVRDRLGIKPLYYCLNEDGLAFASEIKCLFALSPIARRCEIGLLREWLYYGNPLGSRTLYQGIRRLLPGTFLEFDLRSFSAAESVYWSLEQQATECQGRGASDDIARTQELLSAAVGRQLVSDVPIGIFLSGGIDSSAITAFATRHAGEGVTTYSAGFQDLEGADERPKARRVARHFGTDHHEIRIGSAELPSLVERMVWHHDQPFSDSANIPVYLMAREIADQTKVILQGDGGDEVFGGYRRYASLRYRPWLHLAARCGSIALPQAGKSSYTRRAVRYAHAYRERRIAVTMAKLLTPIDPTTAPETVFAEDLQRVLAGFDPFRRYREVQEKFARHDISNQMSFVDMSIELPDIFLEKVDRAAMAASVEVRVPFLDHELVDFAVGLRGQAKLPWGKKKWLLKQALVDVLPAEILEAPKSGFNVPFSSWLRGPLKPLFFDHLNTLVRRHPAVLDRGNIEKRFARLESGALDFGNTLWNVLNLMIWANQMGVEFVFPAD